MLILIVLVQLVIVPVLQIECLEKFNLLEHKIEAQNGNIVEQFLIRELQDLRRETATQREIIQTLVKDLEDQRKDALAQHQAIQLLIEETHEQRKDLLQQKETINALSAKLEHHINQLLETNTLHSDLQAKMENNSHCMCSSNNEASIAHAHEFRLDLRKHHAVRVNEMKANVVTVEKKSLQSSKEVTEARNVERSSMMFRGDFDRKTRLILPIPTSKPSTIVAFHAVTSLQYVQHVGVNQKIRFDKINLNIGGGFNNNVDFFTPPVPGVYLFSVSIESFKSHEEIYVAIVHNGHMMAKAHAGGNERTSQGSVTISIQLKSGDMVYVMNLYNTSSYYGNLFSSFTGILVSQT
ncbi:hypothetical protein ACF0H5_006909 [Mactra antiquata]